MPTLRLLILSLLAALAGCADLEWNWRGTGEGLMRAGCNAMRNCAVTDGRLVP
jgi:hypothetical protein